MSNDGGKNGNTKPEEDGQIPCSSKQMLENDAKSRMKASTFSSTDSINLAFFNKLWHSEGKDDLKQILGKSYDPKVVSTETLNLWHLKPVEENHSSGDQNLGKDFLNQIDESKKKEISQSCSSGQNSSS